MGLDGHDGTDLMTLFDNNALGSFGDMSMTLDSNDDKALAQSFATGNANPTTEESVARAENQFNTAANNVPGAGPMPPGSFAQMSLSSGSTLTEFTKRRNWPAKVVEELKDFLKILDANGRIKYASSCRNKCCENSWGLNYIQNIPLEKTADQSVYAGL